MITLKTADEALKNFYLDAVAENLNNKVNPLLARIQRTETGVSGKDVKVFCNAGVNGNFIAGTETDELPTGGESKYVKLGAPLKNLYGTLEISDKALRVSAKDEGALINLLETEMENLVKSATVNFGRMLFGDGSGKLTDVESYSDGVFYVEDMRNLFEGMYFDVDIDGETYEKIEIVNIDRTEKTISVKGDLPDEGDVIGALYMHGSKDNELLGLKALFEKESIYGVNRDNSFMKTHDLFQDDLIYEDTIQKMMDEIEISSGRKTDYIVCTHGVRRSLIKQMRRNGTAINTIEIEGGEKALDFYGVPVVVDRFCPKGEMYLLSTECFKLCQLCDWQWLEAEDGKILKQIPGKPAYTATLVKYAELICDMPCAQGRITGITEE